MKPTFPPKFEIMVSGAALDFDDPPGYYKDIYFPSDPSGDIVRMVRLRFVFQGAGFEVKTIEKVQEHSVWIVRLRSRTPHILDKNKFVQTVRQLLGSIEIQVRTNELMTQITNNQILISFLMPPSAPEPNLKAELRRLLLELP